MKSGNYFTKISQFKGSKFWQVTKMHLSVTACYMYSHKAAANAHTNKGLKKYTLVSYVCLFCFVTVDQGECRRTEATVVVKIHKQTNKSPPFCPIKTCSPLLRPIIADPQRYFPAVHNKLTNHKENTC